MNHVKWRRVAVTLRGRVVQRLGHAEAAASTARPADREGAISLA